MPYNIFFGSTQYTLFGVFCYLVSFLDYIFQVSKAMDEQNIPIILSKSISSSIMICTVRVFREFFSIKSAIWVVHWKYLYIIIHYLHYWLMNDRHVFWSRFHPEKPFIILTHASHYIQSFQHNVSYITVYEKLKIFLCVYIYIYSHKEEQMCKWVMNP